MNTSIGEQLCHNQTESLSNFLLISQQACQSPPAISGRLPTSAKFETPQRGFIAQETLPVAAALQTFH
jgi:hypothetical protein